MMHFMVYVSCQLSFETPFIFVVFCLQQFGKLDMYEAPFKQIQFGLQSIFVSSDHGIKME